MASPLRTAWGLEIDPEDPHGTGPGAVRCAGLPAELSRALDGARDRLPIPHGDQDPDLREALAAPARASADEPLPFPLLHQYARFWRDGVRTDHEDRARRLEVLTGQAVLAALGTADVRWLDRAADGLLLLCEMSTWCWVAHEDAHDRHGWVLPDPECPVVDLGAAQVLQVLAWADLAVGDWLDERVPGPRTRMRREARLRVFEPYLGRREWNWLHGAAHNWTGWIHQHLIAGALFLLDGEEARGQRDAIIALSIAQLDRYLASFPDDGGIDEGFSYFWNGASRLLEAVDLLITASDGLLSADAAARIPVIGELLRFPHRMELGQGWFVNVADGPALPPSAQPWDVLHRWGSRLGDADVVDGALARRGHDPVPPVLPELGLGRVLMALADPDWRRAPVVGARPPLPAETWLPEIQLLVARERAGDDRGLALVVKGGHNDEAHNHLDVGSVIVACDASPVLIDLGQPTYTATTFTERRYETWAMTSSWHNLPTIRGHEQGIGARYRARGVRVRSADHGPSGVDATAPVTTFTADLAPAYPVEAGLSSYRREVGLRGEDPSVQITDTWHLDPATPIGGTGGDPTAERADIVLNHVLAGEVLAHEPGNLRLRALSGTVVDLRWDPHAGLGDLERRENDDPLLAQSWGSDVHRLRLSVPTDPNGNGRFTLQISTSTTRDRISDDAPTS